jgi:hypothetical protein
MGYDPDLESERSHKTGRIAILSLLTLILALFVFLFKIDACTTTPDKCKDEFFELVNGRDYGNQHTCPVGATAEIVNSPPAPKPGILCHCANNAPANSASNSK